MFHLTLNSMKILLSLIGLLLCGSFIGCARNDKLSYMFLGPIMAGGVTYYPAHPGTTVYDIVDYTTNPPPAGVIPSVTLVTTNAYWTINRIDGNVLAHTNVATK
jgi:hypothetical protein